METGDADVAFAPVHQDHSRAVYGLVRRICGPGRGGEVAQDVFAQLWTHPERFDPARGSLRSFLLDSATTTAVEANRSAAPPAGVDGDQDPIGPDQIHLERSTRLAWALSTLPAPERDAVVSVRYCDGAYPEAARILAVSDDELKARVRAGLMKLRLAVDDGPAPGRDRTAVPRRRRRTRRSAGP